MFIICRAENYFEKKLKDLNRIVLKLSVVSSDKHIHTFQNEYRILPDHIPINIRSLTNSNNPQRTWNRTQQTRPPLRGNAGKTPPRDTNPSKFANGTTHNTNRKVNAIKRRTPRRACSEDVMFAHGVQERSS